MRGMVPLVHWLVVSIREDSDLSVGSCRLELRLVNGRTMRSSAIFALRFLLDERASALAAMAATAALLLSDGSKIGRFLLSVGIIVEASFGALFGLAKVDAFLFGMVRFIGFTAVAFDVGGSFLALEAAVLALGNRTALLGHEGQFAIWATVSRDCSTASRMAGLGCDVVSRQCDSDEVVVAK